MSIPFQWIHATPVTDVTTWFNHNQLEWKRGSLVAWLTSGIMSGSSSHEPPREPPVDCDFIRTYPGYEDKSQWYGNYANYVTLRIMGSQNWWFGDPRPLLYTSKPLYSRVQWFLGYKWNYFISPVFFPGPPEPEPTSISRVRPQGHESSGDSTIATTHWELCCASVIKKTSAISWISRVQLFRFPTPNPTFFRGKTTNMTVASSIFSVFCS